MAINKEKAIDLRKQGHTYQQIADALGCSVDWCKRNLSKIPKNTKSIDVYALCRQKAQSRDGITNQEIQHNIRLCFPEYTTYKQIEPEYKRIKRKLNQDKECVIRPHWMIPNKAQQCMSSLLMSVNALEDRINDEINTIRSELGLSDEYSRGLLYSLISLTSGGVLLHGRPVESIIDGLQHAIEKLEDRNNIGGAPFDTYNTMQPKSVVHLDEITLEGVFDGVESVFDEVQTLDIPDSLPIEAYL